MAWSTPMTAVANTGLTAAQWNASVRDNLLQTTPAKASDVGSYFVTSDVNEVEERILGFDSIPTSETTASTSFTNLATTGPTVTATTGPRALGLHTAKMANDTVGGQTYAAVELTGSTSFSPIDNLSLQFTSGIANASNHASYVVTYECSAGSTDFIMRYRVNVGTGTFLFRRLTVLPY